MEVLPSYSVTWRVPGWVYGDKDVDNRRLQADRLGNRDDERFDDLRRRLEGASRAAAAASGEGQGQGQASGVEEGRREGVVPRRPLAGQILDRFRGAF